MVGTTCEDVGAVVLVHVEDEHIEGRIEALEELLRGCGERGIAVMYLLPPSGWASKLSKYRSSMTPIEYGDRPCDIADRVQILKCKSKLPFDAGKIGVYGPEDKLTLVQELMGGPLCHYVDIPFDQYSSPDPFDRELDAEEDIICGEDSYGRMTDLQDVTEMYFPSGRKIGTVGLELEASSVVR